MAEKKKEENIRDRSVSDGCDKKGSRKNTSQCSFDKKSGGGSHVIWAMSFNGNSTFQKEASLGMTILMISPVSTARGGGLLALAAIEVKVTVAAASTSCPEIKGKSAAY